LGFLVSFVYVNVMWIFVSFSLKSIIVVFDVCSGVLSLRHFLPLFTTLLPYCLCNCNTLTFLWANTIKPLMSYNSWSPIVPHHHHLLHPEITGKLPRQSTKIKLGR
jgi:hypothetical protein